jgi:ferredoxin
MATMIIADECINCGACVPECPNEAISEGDVGFVIDPEACTECVGFFGYEACQRVCPEEVCVPDPARREDETVLLARARRLHPEREFPEPLPASLTRFSDPDRQR